MTSVQRPVLSDGSHAHPARGACFMEVASLLAGEEFSDFPPCADMRLARMCQEVNDASDHEQRQELLELVPRVVGTAQRDRWGAMADRNKAMYAFMVDWARDHGISTDPHPVLVAEYATLAGRGKEFLSDLLDWFDAYTGRTTHWEAPEERWALVAEQVGTPEEGTDG